MSLIFSQTIPSVNYKKFLQIHQQKTAKNSFLEKISYAIPHRIFPCFLRDNTKKFYSLKVFSNLLHENNKRIIVQSQDIFQDSSRDCYSYLGRRFHSWIFKRFVQNFLLQDTPNGFCYKDLHGLP